MGDLASGAGWGWPVNSRKCHFFEQGIALCGKWMFFGAKVDNQSKTKSIDDCVACSRKLDSRTVVKAKKTKVNEGMTGVNL